jgi:outer membrane protein assembly factor BamB
VPQRLLIAWLSILLLSSCGSPVPNGTGTLPTVRPPSPARPTSSGSTAPAGTATPPTGSAPARATTNPTSPPIAAPSPTPIAATPTHAPTSSPAPPIPADWPLYHRDPARTGNDPAFPPFRGSLTRAWSTPLDGAVYGEPLVVDGRVIAATEGDSVYALDPASGRIVWRRHLGSPVPLASLPCGDIDPLGITSTPAYDPASGSLFVVAEVNGPHHVLFALDPATGAVRWSRGIDLPGDDPATHQQRAALALGNGYVYVGMGGLYGDCGQYQGELIGVPVTGTGPTISYRVPVAREGAIWASGGPVLDGQGHVYVSTGNGSSTTTYDGSDSVIELSPTLTLRSRFAPASWASDNANDLDLGSLSPVLVPGGWVFIVGKSGTGYVLRQGTLGGIGGQVSATAVCTAFGGAAQAGATLYVPCTTGLAQVTISAAGSISVGWQTASGADGPPVIGGGAVWSLDLGRGELLALDPRTGKALAHVAVGSVPHFASPTLWNGQVFVGTDAGVTAINAR